MRCVQRYKSHAHREHHAIANDRVIKVLKDMIKTTLDSHKVLVDAADDTGSAHAQFYAQMAQERSQVASQMQAQVSALGGTPEDSSGVAAAAHRTFVDIKQAVMGQDDQAVIN